MTRMTIDEAIAWVDAHPAGLEYEASQLPVAKIWAEDDPSLMDNPDFMGNKMIDNVEEAKAQWEAEEFDIAETGRPACDCAPGEPCCMKGLKIGCSHKADRLVLPLTDPNGEARIAVYTDKGEGDGHDMMKFTPEVVPIAGCTQPNKVPVLIVKGTTTRRYDLSGPVEAEAIYTDNLFEVPLTDTARFGVAVYKILFGDLDEIAKTYDLSVRSCYGTTIFDSTAYVYPKMELISTGLEFEIKAKLFSNMTFVPSTKFTAGIEAKFGSSSFKIEGDDTEKPDNPLAVSDSVPFIDRVAKRLARMTSGGAAPAGNGTHSSIEVYSKIKLGASKFKLSEHPTDPSKVGIDGVIDFGVAPLIGLKVTLDLIDLALTAAQVMAPPLAAAIQRAKNARESLNRGVGSFDEDSNLGLRGHVGITLEIDGQIGNAGVKLVHPLGATRWEGTGYVGGSIELKCEAVLEAEGKAYIIEGTFAARGSAASKLNAELKTLTPAEQAEKNGKKLKLKVDWDGVTLKYSVSYKASFLVIFETSDEAAGDLPLVGEEDLVEEYY